MYSVNDEVSGAQALAQSLEALGVSHIFGMDTPEPLYAELANTGIRAITVHDERAGAVMADAFGRVSGRPGVCGAIRGPGATNLITALAEAYNTSTPVIALVNDVATDNIDRNTVQAIDHVSLAEQVTKWGIRIDSPSRVQELIERGFAIATSGRPAPVILSYAETALFGKGVRKHPVTEDVEYPRHRVAADPQAIRAAAAQIAAAERPILLTGGGIHLSRAYAQLQELAELLEVPVATTPLGKGGFPEDHRLSAGVTGSYTIGELARGRVTNRLVRDADLVVFVGSKTDSNATADWTVPRQDQASIHIDIDPVEIGRNYESFPLVGDAALVLEQLLDELRQTPVPQDLSRSRSEVIARMHRWFEDWETETLSLRTSDASPIRPERISAEIQKVLGPRGIITTDASYSSAWAMDLVKLEGAGRRYLAPRGFAGLGWGVPAAIGAKLASPDSPVVCLTGDGGFGYVAMELETAVRYNVPIVVVVLNNGILGFQKHFEEEVFGGSFEVEFSAETDYAALARSLGCDGIKVDDASQLGSVLAEALASGRPTLIDVVTDPEVKAPISTFEGNEKPQLLEH